MILESDYLNAKQIVEQYENQQRIIEDRFKNGDRLLITIFNKRALTCFEIHNEHYAEKGKELAWLSDLVKFVSNNGGRIALLKMRNMGKKTVNEIMSIVEPLL
jgi:hypothetical protein